MNEMKVKDLIELLKQYNENETIELWCNGGIGNDGLEFSEASLMVYNSKAKPHECWEEIMNCEV